MSISLIKPQLIRKPTRREFLKYAGIGAAAFGVPMLLKIREAQAAIAVDKSSNYYRNGATETSTAVSFTATPTTGALVVAVGWGYCGAGFGITSVTDNQTGNSYTAVAYADGGNTGSFIAWAYNVNASGTFTVTVNWSAATYPQVKLISFTGIATASAVDQTGTGLGTSNAPSVTAAGNTAQADELVIAALSFGANSIVTPATTGYTNIAVETDNSNYVGGAADYKIISTIQTPSAAWSSANTGTWYSIMRTFKQAAATRRPGKPIFFQ